MYLKLFELVAWMVTIIIAILECAEGKHPTWSGYFLAIGALMMHLVLNVIREM